MTTYTLNAEHNGIEISFDSIPSKETRETLKADGFRWHNMKKVWYAKQTAERLALAEKLAGTQETLTHGFTLDGEGRYSGWTGDNATCGLYGKELKNAIVAELKRNGIKATGRTGRGGYTDSFTFTITIPKEQQISLEEYTEATKNDRRISYWTADGKRIDNIWSLPYDEMMAVRAETCRREYEEDDAAKASKSFKELVKKIVASFNSNHSDVYTDYFDVGFYAYYEYKAA